MTRTTGAVAATMLEHLEDRAELCGGGAASERAGVCSLNSGEVNFLRALAAHRAQMSGSQIVWPVASSHECQDKGRAASSRSKTRANNELVGGGRGGGDDERDGGDELGSKPRAHECS